MRCRPGPRGRKKQESDELKRPLVYVGVIFLLSMVMLYKVGSRESGSPYHTAVSLMEEENAKSGTIAVRGTVSECSAVSAGLRLSVSHLTIQKETSDLSLPSDLKLSITIEDTKEDTSAGQYDVEFTGTSTGNFEYRAVERSANVQPGDEILAQGKFRAYEQATNPGQFDAKEYYSTQNILGTLKCSKLSVTHSSAGGIDRAAYRLRCMLRESYERILEERAARTISAIALGEKSWMEREWKGVYQEGGISHILAISGLHISLVGMCIYRLLRKLGLRFGPAALLSGGALMFYVTMAGFSVSAVRAMIMFFIWLGAQVCGRKYDMITGMAVAASFLAGTDVRNLFQASFLLSFSAITSLAVLVPSITESCRIRTAVGKSVAASAAVWMGTLPCTLYFFFQVSPWSILVNLAVVPLMTVLMAFGLTAAMVGVISVQAGTFLAAPVYYLLACFEWLCSLEQKLPMAVWVAGRPNAVCIILYYGVIVAVVCILRLRARMARQEKPGEKTGTGKHLRRGHDAAQTVDADIRKQKRHDAMQVADMDTQRQKRNTVVQTADADIRKWRGHDATQTVDVDIRKWRGHDAAQIADANARKQKGHAVLIWMCCGAICIFLMGFHPRGDLQIDCLDVGQGDCALIRLPTGENCLIDGGSTSKSSIWEYTMEPAVKYYGIRTIDYIFLSHADRDHINGITEYLESYDCGFGGKNVHGVSVKNIVLPVCHEEDDFAELKNLADRNGIKVWSMEAGNRIAGSSWELCCLAPSSDTLTGDKNEDSMVLMLSCGQFRMLFTGDLEGEAEKRLALSGQKLQADILKAGHHGSAGASSREFLEQVSPKLSVISCGKNNSYGHPAKETLQRLEEAGSGIIVTAVCGAVKITTDGKTYTVKTYADCYSEANSS